MKKQNWVGISLLGSLVCMIAFGAYVVSARQKNTVYLEDIQGDAAYLKAFPLEGVMGDQTESTAFTLINGNLETKHCAYGTDDWKAIEENHRMGIRGIHAYLYAPISGDHFMISTNVVPAKGAKQEYTQECQVGLFDAYTDAVKGETITTDAVEVLCDVEAFYMTSRGIHSAYGRSNIARFSTGLVMRDQPYIFAVGAEEHERLDYINYRHCYNNYNDSYAGEEDGVHQLRDYVTNVGNEIYAVVAPDQRCEGTTYVYRVSVEAEKPATYSGDMDFSDFLNMREEYGTAEPIVAVPDAKESSVVGLEGIGENQFALFSVKDNMWVVDVYDAKGALVGSVKQEIQWDTIPNYRFTGDPRFEIKCRQTKFEDGISLSVNLRGTMYEDTAKTSSDYGSTYETDIGRMLLWITKEGVTEMPMDDTVRDAVSNGKQVLYWDIQAAEEGKKLDEIKRYGTMDEVTIKIIDAQEQNTLYEGRLRTDCWQDKLTEIANIDNAKENGYLQMREGAAFLESDIRQIEQLRVMDWKE